MPVQRRLLGSILEGSYDVNCGPRPDCPPNTVNVDDEEFNDPALAGWTTITSGATNHNANTTVTSCLWASTGSGASSGSFIIYKAIPAIPFRVTAKVAGYANRMATSQRTDVGLLLGASTPNSGFIHGALDIAEDQAFVIGGSYWTNATTFSTNIGDFSSGGTLAGSAWATPGFGLLRPHWVRFEVNSQSDVDGYVSWDGLVYTRWLTNYNPSFDVATVGLDMHCTTGETTEAAWDYIRFEAL